jgi:hypothetical protein
MLADFQNVGGFPKCWRIYKILVLSKMLADFQNIGALKKYRRIYKNVGVWQKYRRTIESWRTLKSPHLVKYQRIWKKLAARLLFGLGGISNC